jgi:hypothetical protein
MSEPEATFHVPIFCEVLDRLAHEIREARKVSAAQLEWFKAHSGNEDFNEKQLKRFSELDGSVKSAIKMAKEEILAQVKPKVRFWMITIDPDEPIPKG